MEKALRMLTGVFLAIAHGHEGAMVQLPILTIGGSTIWLPT